MTETPSEISLLQQLAYHVFLPPALPQAELGEAADRQVSSLLVETVISAMRTYATFDTDSLQQCNRMISMLENFSRSITSPLRQDQLSQDMLDLKENDALVLYIRAQNTAVIVRKFALHTVFEVFEVQPSAANVVSVPGKLVRHFPGPAAQVPNAVANDTDFTNEIANFLSQMDTQKLEEAAVTAPRTGPHVSGIRDSTNPQYFIQLFLGILRGMGDVAEPAQVVKRIAEEVLGAEALTPWRRSPIWLIVRVAVQTTLRSNSLYKSLMLFYFADILSRCRAQAHPEFSSDLLYTMRVKLCHRLFKVRDSAPQFIVEKISGVANDVEEILQARWKNIQTQTSVSPDWSPDSLDFDAAAVHSLPHLGTCIKKLFQAGSRTRRLASFTLTHALRLQNIDDFASYANNNLAKAFSEDGNVALFNFEASVYDQIAGWTERNLAHALSACEIIVSCYHQYQAAAQSYYTADVADMSIMMLTLARMWVAIDQLSTHECPLLLEFSPELPEDLLDSLLLRTSQHIAQANIIQGYLHKRHQDASMQTDSIFSANIGEQAFAVRYFLCSPSLQECKRSIEDDAASKKQRKLEELRDQNNKHARLTHQLTQLNCTYYNRYDRSGAPLRVHDVNQCEKCRVIHERDNMKIKLHEWPLPSNELQAQAVVFELQRPAIFTLWRDVTYKLLAGLKVAEQTSSRAALILDSYRALSPWLTLSGGISAQIVLASTTKSTIRACRSSSTSIPAEEGRVCVENGLSFRLYDKGGLKWVSSLTKSTMSKDFGTFVLPRDSPYTHLQFALDGTTHTLNEIIADQYKCPDAISLHEHLAFGTIRSGPRLQWMNIARALEEGVLSLKHREVNLLYNQAAWQIGPLDDTGQREWHLELHTPEFANLLILQAEELLDRFKANWIEASSLYTIIILVTRLLSASPSPGETNHRDGAYRFLRNAREVAFKWVLALKDKLTEVEDEDFNLQYRNRLCETAAICRSTYDVDPDHISNLLVTPGDFRPLITCSMVLHGNKPPDLENANKSLQVYYHRDYRLSHKLLPFVQQKLCSSDVLCESVRDMWPNYQGDPAGWSVLSASDARWEGTNTISSSEQNSQVVYLDLLEGHLLVDFNPIGCLPREYVQHPTYVRLFGQASDSGCSPFEFAFDGVSFLLTDTRELVVQARKDGRTCELLPVAKVDPDFPEIFSADYHHWLDLETKILEFRPLLDPWSDDPPWKLHLSENGNSLVGTMRAQHESLTLIDIHSGLFRALSLQLKPLESLRHLHVTKLPNGRIEVELPRMNLSFFLNNEKLIESKNFRGTILDKDQSTGTMFGLDNALVLCARNGGGAPTGSFHQRAVLIPHGDVEFERSNHHVRISVNTDRIRNVQVYRYDIDTDLGRLTNDTGLTSRLFCIYLHALTSHCLPDPLTGRTGTQEALSMLFEAASSSFAQLDKEQTHLLGQISHVAPHYSYHPKNGQHRRVIQWSTLPPLSQCYAFYPAAKNILKRATALQVFQPVDFPIDGRIEDNEFGLLEHAARRTSIYYPSELSVHFEATLGRSLPRDTAFMGRESTDSQWVEKGQRAAWAAGLSYRNWGQVLLVPYDLLSLVETWDSMKGLSNNLSLTYSSLWLGLSLPESWIDLYDVCRLASVNSNRYALACCLASAAFSTKLPTDLVPVLLAFATTNTFSTIAPPMYFSFALTDGYNPNESGPGYDSPERLIEAERHSSRQRNSDLRDFLKQIERILSSGPPSEGLAFANLTPRVNEPPPAGETRIKPWNAASLEQLLATRPCPVSGGIEVRTSFTISRMSEDRINTSRLSDLLSEFKNSSRFFYRQYGQMLDDSRSHLARQLIPFRHQRLPHPQLLRNNCNNYHLSLQDVFEDISLALGPLTPVEHIVSTCGVWPRITPQVLLQQLTLKSRSGTRTSPEWQDCLIEYARLVVAYQRSQRLVTLAQSDDAEGFWKELESDEYDLGADARNPDWLLAQIDGNFSIRSIQGRVAQEMISPSSSENTVLQLNMGEGKSSVILPIIAACLANGTKLVRAVVLKPLWRQTFHLLANRVSRLLNRRIYYLPFARDKPIDTTFLNQLDQLYSECTREGGILLAQPEHVLSFKLTASNHIIMDLNRTKVTGQIESIQERLNKSTRDIIDESDEILHVRYQLVYTIGDQHLLECHPNRWIIAQELLQLLAWHISHLNYGFDQGVRFERQSTSQFPIIQILPHCENEVGGEIISALANDVVLDKISVLNCTRLPPDLRLRIIEFLTVNDLPFSRYMDLKRSCNSGIWDSLLIIRGLLASGIFMFALKEKRYRVNYGLDLTRSLMAVPFQAKDIPSLRSEFGHPDVAIVLTCLSYYYQGLTSDQLKQCFTLLFRLDSPSAEYNTWLARNETTPNDLQRLSGVNTRDYQQFKTLILPTFSHNTAVIEFFLNYVVFPKSAKEFTHKLSASGWDLAESKAEVTTGFSGTNDNRYLLPTSITQIDLAQQLSTNALVLTHILRPENNQYLCLLGQENQMMRAGDFLDLLVRQKPEIRVLLDVGAQMLELQNEDLVRRWLCLTPTSNVEAAVYFNDRDELVVLPRNGKPSPFYSSPYSQQLDKCIVYLDDGHTRGTDLKLPRNFRALVTLGPGVTKDRLLQGCMRMRKLGHEHSVMFAAPPEIDSQIRRAIPIPVAHHTVDALDVLRWAMQETCKDLRHHVSTWAQQGIEYNQRLVAQQSYSRTKDVSVLRAGWMMREARSLEDMYGIRCPSTESPTDNPTARASNITGFHARLQLLGIDELGDSRMAEELKREVDHEMEQEHQVARLTEAEPAEHKIHPDVRHFITTGRIPVGSSGFQYLFQPLIDMSPNVRNAWSKSLFASIDFSRTLKTLPASPLNDYMRPVNWIVRGANGIWVALSPYEVNELLPEIRQSNCVWLHIYATRATPVTGSFSAFNFSIPARLCPEVQPVVPTARLQLDLFAGQLYFSSYQDYAWLCAILGIHNRQNTFEQPDEIKTDLDGFVNRENRESLIDFLPEYGVCKFETSPVPLLRELINRRRKGMRYFSTHLGQLLHGRSVLADSFST